MISCWNCNYRWFLSSSRWFSVYFFPGGLSSQWKCLKWMCKTSWTSALEWRETKNIGGHGQNSLKLQWYDIEIYWNQGQGGDFKDSLSYYILLIVLKLKPPTTGSKWCPWCVCVCVVSYLLRSHVSLIFLYKDTLYGINSELEASSLKIGSTWIHYPT